MKPFLVLTAGRSGSTALMDALARYDDIAVPHKQIDCLDNELLHPRFIKAYMEKYRQLTGLAIHGELSLIHAFYECNRNVAYAGFKSMPERHRHLDVLARMEGMQLITLRRNDVASTVASFLAAFDAGTWRREGETQKHKLVFAGSEYERRAIGHLRYIESCDRQLQSFSNAVHLEYEGLCTEGFCCQKLDDFFGRHIQLINPKPPTCASSYVENWGPFVEFINRNRQ